MTSDPQNDLRTLGEIGDRIYTPKDRPWCIGPAASRPSASLVPRNSFFYATDTGATSFSDGTTWVTAENPRSGTAAGKPAAGAGNSGWFYYETDTNILWYSNGSVWTQVGGSTTTFGTSLPGSPSNTDTYTLTDSTTSPTYIWHLRYFSTPGKWYPMQGSWGYGTTLPSPPSPIDRVRFTLVDSTSAPTYDWDLIWNAGSGSSYKWEFVGGSSMRAEVNTSNTISSSTFVDAGTVGPSLTIPKDGDYVLSYGCFIGNTASAAFRGVASPKIGGATAAEADGVSFAGPSPGGGSAENSGARQLIKTALTASTVIKLQYRRDGADQSFDRRYLHITPVRIV